jgi:hypothetical protein
MTGKAINADEFFGAPVDKLPAGSDIVGGKRFSAFRAEAIHGGYPFTSLAL